MVRIPRHVQKDVPYPLSRPVQKDVPYLLSRPVQKDGPYRLSPAQSDAQRDAHGPPVAGLPDVKTGVAGRRSKQFVIVLVEKIPRPHGNGPTIRPPEADACVGQRITVDDEIARGA